MGGMGKLHDRLYGGLWHTTRPDRVLSIVASQSILVEPDIDDRERWNTANGPRNYPIARAIGGVSLFDFCEFDSENYDQRFPLSSWRTFVPHVQSWRGSVWLQIDRDVVKNQLMSSDTLLRKWKYEGFHSHNILPALEAAHIGDLPVSAINSAFLTWDDGREVCDFDVRDFDHALFSQIVGEWQDRIKNSKR